MPAMPTRSPCLTPAIELVLERLLADLADVADEVRADLLLRVAALEDLLDGRRPGTPSGAPGGSRPCAMSTSGLAVADENGWA